ncbi:MAG: ABC transporter permease subunit [Thermoplasmata archaeon]|nr:ABC transporter permease subunit [Thermoplasmata archaeon]
MMATSRQIKEKLRDYRRSVKHSWNLFRESRIGMVGLLIMVLFVVMALISPYLGLRHPTDWWAPDEDILEITPYFNMDEGVRTVGPFTQGLAYRMRPAAGTGTSCDRMYAAGGTGSDFQPFGLYAYSQSDGSKIWDFNSQSQISTELTVNNYGSETVVNNADLRIFFGCENGRLYVLKDGFVENSAAYAPAGANIWSYMLDGTVVGKVAIHDQRGNGFDGSDLFFASTTNGTLYAFEGPTPQYNPVTGLYNVTQPILLWANHISNVSLTAPTVSGTGQQVFVGTSDGWLYGIDVASGFEIPEWDGVAYKVSDNYWSSCPTAVGNPTVVYAPTDDGLIHCIWGTNGTVKTGWTHDENQPDGSVIRKDGFQLADNRVPDEGNLTEVSMPPDGSYIIVGSDTGYLYSINTNTVNISIVFDTKVGTQQTSVNVKPYYDWRFSKYMFVTAINFNDTATDPSDDFSILYCMASPGNSSIIWRKTITDVMVAPPTSFINNEHVSNADVVFATVHFDSNGTATGGRMYSYSAAGKVITPLPPTWVTPSNSGNTYWLGTDDRGHDILSQVVLGSRIALLVGFLSAIFSIGIGVIFGLVSGYYGGAIDAILMRFTDVILVLPALPLLITFAAIMSPSIWNIILIISLVGWGGVARVIRAEVLSLKERPFIDSARVTGASKSRIMFKHIAPNVLPLGLLYMTFAVSGAILFEAALSFIGLGDPSTMTWGMMLNYVQHSDALTNWWWLLPPGICITLVCMSFFMLGRAFDEIVNPRLRRRR